MKSKKWIFLALAAIVLTSCHDDNNSRGNDVTPELPDYYYTGGKLGTTSNVTASAYEQETEAINKQGLLASFKRGERIFESPFDIDDSESTPMRGLDPPPRCGRRDGRPLHPVEQPHLPVRDLCTPVHGQTQRQNLIQGADSRSSCLWLDFLLRCLEERAHDQGEEWQRQAHPGHQRQVCLPRRLLPHGLKRGHAVGQRLHIIGQIILYPAVFLLTIGVFIGAIWANVSWGSYWSWDPKEVWALITLIIYALPLHGQSLPMFRKPQFFHGYCVIAFLSVLITYFGVNFILGGLHSYA